MLAGVSAIAEVSSAVLAVVQFWNEDEQWSFGFNRFLLL
ncbi:hypothetical protein V2J09_013363 [Rumex salicifolius]